MLDTPAIIGIAAGAPGTVLLLTVVCLLMLNVYCCARRGSHESKSQSWDCCGKNGPPKLFPPGNILLINKDPPELILLRNIYLKNLDHFPQMKNVDPEHISLTKFGPVAYPGGLLRFLEAS